MSVFFRTSCFLVLGISMLASCSRPVAYFQPTPREHFTNPPLTTSDNVIIPVKIESTTPTMASPAQQVAQATAALDQVDSMVRNDTKLATNKIVQKRLGRIRIMLASTAVNAERAPLSSAAPKKMNLMQRLMVKKLNRKITRQLAPAQPDKTMALKSILALGAVLVLGGLLLMLLTTGTGFAIGVIALAAGLVCLLIGLL